MDPELPYYIWTLNERFRDQEDEYPSFYDRPEGCDNLRLHHVTFNQREDSSIFVAGRPFLPARNKPSVRQRMHRPQAVVPPVPAGQNP